MKLLKVFLLIGSIVLAIIIVPILINETYKVNSGYITIWGASEVFSFYGTILSAIIGIGGVFLTIRYAQKNYQQDTINRSLPFLSINHLGRKPVNLLLEGWDLDNPSETVLDKQPQQHTDKPRISDENTYQEYARNCWYFSIKPASLGPMISISEKLTDSQKDLRKYAIADVAELQGNFYVSASSSVYIPLQIKNVGNGCALNTTVEFGPVERKTPTDSIPISLGTSDKMHVAIMAESIKNIAGKYRLAFRYTDILGNKYCQSSILELIVNEHGNATIKGLEMFLQVPEPPKG